MPEWLDPVQAIDLVLVIMVVEALVVAWSARRSAVPGWLANLAAGALLLLAVRAALAGSPQWLVVWLAASGVAHAIDVAFRVRARASLPPATS